VKMKKRVEEILEKLKPRLDELAEGYVELIELDEGRNSIKLKLIGGRLC
jgi:Fe-S cluster biogenesis protein NfuA